MSYQAVKYVLQHSPIYGKARMVLLCLAYHTGMDGLAWPGVNLISSECRLRKSEVLNCLKVLLRSGEICITDKGRPRSSAKYLMLRFLETPDVGAPTVKILRGASEEIARDLTVPGMKTRVYSVPTVSGGTFSGSHCIQAEPIAVPDIFDEREPSGGEKTPQWEPQGGPAVPDSVPTVFSGNQSSQKSHGSQPLDFTVSPSLSRLERERDGVEVSLPSEPNSLSPKQERDENAKKNGNGNGNWHGDADRRPESTGEMVGRVIRHLRGSSTD